MPFPQTIEELEAAGYVCHGPALCSACPAPITWWKTPAGKMLPTERGTAKPHWATCPGAERLRRRKAVTK